MKKPTPQEKRTVVVTIDKAGNTVGACTTCGETWTIKAKNTPKTQPGNVNCPSGCTPKTK